MLTAIVVNVHVIVSLGGGLSGMFGGGMRAATGFTLLSATSITPRSYVSSSSFSTVIPALRLQ